ncbi:nose resistant to fluoxetine protein 6-like isoform X1 [Leptidea sinapis]|uniref:nose resistant to fluoxetine protein 6-like isoform X1 n=1 Tax=Leptidea sinapis TaxID=189913 RepID=UPI00212708E8|nr:nose resistant to fluoxetine protein 6-like isoform X1 [Leptidea sinapis]
MTRHTLALLLILITFSIFTSVIAFRVRLPHEHVKNKCDSCNGKELDPESKQSVTSEKRVNDDLKKSVREKLAPVSVDEDDSDEDSQSTFNINAKSSIGLQTHHNIIKEPEIYDDSEEDDEDEINTIKHDEKEDNRVVEDDKENVEKVSQKDHLKKSVGSAANRLKPKFELKIDDDDDDDDDSDEDEEYIDHIPKSNNNTKVEKKIVIKKDESVTITQSPSKVTERSLKPNSKVTEKDNTNEVNLRQTRHKGKENDDNLKEMETKTKDVKPKESLEKIKVKSHIEGGKIQTHVVTTKAGSTKINSEKQTDDERKQAKVEVPLKENTKPSKKVLKSQERGSAPKPISNNVQKTMVLQREFEDLYGYFPTFAPNFSHVHNPECRRHGQILLRQLRGSKLWALNMLDATAKIPSGILQGNGIQLGDFDQCLASRARVQLETGSVVKVQGKYCLVTMDVKSESTDLEIVVDLAQGRNLIKSRVDDPGHFVPRFSTLSWGSCVPSACAPDDVQLMLSDALEHYRKIGVSFRVKVNELDCHVQKTQKWDDWLEIPTLLTLFFYAMIILLVVIATVQDCFTDTQVDNKSADTGEEDLHIRKPDGVISVFSLHRTTKKLLAPAGDDEVPSIHGVRAIATLALIVAHKFLPVAYTPFTNRVKLAEVVSSPLWSWCRVGWIFTDCFLMLSGALSAYRTSGRTNVLDKLMSKYIRLTPALLAVVWFYAYIWDNISVGPMWGGLVTKNAELCRSSWWWNLFYMQNYYGLEDMCAPQTHQLALDMQLSLFGSVILWMMQSEIVGSKLIIPLIHMAAAYSRYSTFKEHRLTMIAYHGVSVSQLYRTGRMSYTSVFHRSTSYLIGISLGLMLRKPAPVSKPFILLGWVVGCSLGGGVAWAGFDSGHLDYQYTATFAAQYAALAPIASATAFAWLVYAAHNRYSETISNALCSRPLLLISRLSYAIYLTQFIVFLTNAATVRNSREFSIISVIDVQEIATIFISSLLLTLTLVIPLQSLPNLFKTKTKTNNETSEDDKKDINNKIDFDNEIKTNNDILQEIPTLKRPLLAHREVLEEIPEAEVEYEIQRAHENLEEILEEDDEDEMLDRTEDDDLEIIEEEQEEDDHWAGDDHNPDEESEEWELTGINRSGAQYNRYSR